jgi:hypothetical protein
LVIDSIKIKIASGETSRNVILEERDVIIEQAGCGGAGGYAEKD